MELTIFGPVKYTSKLLSKPQNLLSSPCTCYIELGFSDVQCLLYSHFSFVSYIHIYFLLLGPIAGSARNPGEVVPASKKQSNGNLDSSVPSKSERLNSPNTSNWEPDVRMLLSTFQWLKVDFSMILPFPFLLDIPKFGILLLRAPAFDNGYTTGTKDYTVCTSNHPLIFTLSLLC